MLKRSVLPTTRPCLTSLLRPAAATSTHTNWAQEFSSNLFRTRRQNSPADSFQFHKQSLQPADQCGRLQLECLQGEIRVVAVKGPHLADLARSARSVSVFVHSNEGRLLAKAWTGAINQSACPFSISVTRQTSLTPGVPTGTAAIEAIPAAMLQLCSEFVTSENIQRFSLTLLPSPAYQTLPRNSKNEVPHLANIRESCCHPHSYSIGARGTPRDRQRRSPRSAQLSPSLANSQQCFLRIQSGSIRCSGITNPDSLPTAGNVSQQRHSDAATYSATSCAGSVGSGWTQRPAVDQVCDRVSGIPIGTSMAPVVSQVQSGIRDLCACLVRDEQRIQLFGKTQALQTALRDRSRESCITATHNQNGDPR
ncbi:MAG: hypothetical protein JWO13_792 [Acidobacteriales bacterium]|nr:hypothetical protein [Terriglobales bacterium]